MIEKGTMHKSTVRENISFWIFMMFALSPYIIWFSMPIASILQMK